MDVKETGDGRCKHRLAEKGDRDRKRMNKRDTKIITEM